MIEYPLSIFTGLIPDRINAGPLPLIVPINKTIHGNRTLYGNLNRIFISDVVLKIV